MNQIPSKLFPLEPGALLGFCVVLAAACFYTFKTGAALVWPEALTYADLVHQWAGLPHLGLGDSVLPGYAGLLSIAILNPDSDAGHQLLACIQTVLIASTYFPLRAMLQSGGLGKLEAAMLAVAGTLAPVFLVYAPLVAPESLFITALVYFAYFYERLLNGQGYNRSYIGTGLTLLIMLLTQPAGWVVFIASLVVYAVYNCGAKFRAAYAIWLAALFLYAAITLTLQHSFAPNLYFDNPLARFNFIKNGLIYAIYAGAPLAGLSLILAAVLKRGEFWRNSFLVFAFVTLTSVIVLDAFSISIYVEKKLDYASNRMLDPFMFLPLVALFRLSAETRKEFLINGLLVFLVFAFFALPQNLSLDFRSGLGYWAQSLSNPNFAVVRNVVYLMLICIPAAIVSFYPRWSGYGYAVVMLVLFGFAGMDNYKTWNGNVDGNLRFIDARKTPPGIDLAKTPLLTDYTCKPELNKDPSFLFRCIDSAKVLYFTPASMGKPETASPHLFLAADSDIRPGDVVAEFGLAKLTRISGKPQPDVRVARIDRLNFYHLISVAGKKERFVNLYSGTQFHLTSPAKSCVQMLLKAGMDRELNSVSFQLNDEEKKTVKMPRMKNGMPEPTALRLNLPAGDSTLTLTYPLDEGETSQQNTIPQLVLFDRPWFEACK